MPVRWRYLTQTPLRQRTRYLEQEPEDAITKLLKAAVSPNLTVHVRRLTTFRTVSLHPEGPKELKMSACHTDAEP